MSAVAVRPVRAEDAAAIAAIYAPYVRDTAITFELDPPGEAEMRARIATVTRSHPWLVATCDGAVRGYAYADLYRTRAAYRWAIETTVYVDRDHARRGIGRALYAPLIEECIALGFVTALGVLALPNEASVKLHEATGFAYAGTQVGTGYKLGRWHDIGIWQRDLAARTGTPDEPGRRG